MPLLPSKVVNLTNAPLQIDHPSGNPNNAPLVLPVGVEFDLLSSVTLDELSLLAQLLQGLANRGSIRVVATVDSNEDFGPSLNDIVNAVQKIHSAKAVKRNPIRFEDATDLPSVIALVNELKRIVNLMNTL